MRNPKDLVWAGLKRVNAHDGSIGASGGDGVNTCVPVAEMQIADAELAPVRSCGERGERDASALRRRPVVASGLKLQRQPGGSHHLRATPSFGPQRQWLPRDTVARGSLLWLPARAMCVLPRWHTQPAVRPLQNSRYLYPSKARDADYLLGPRRTTRTTCSATEYHRAQSCAIALRSPAPERPSDLNRYSPAITNARS